MKRKWIVGICLWLVGALLIGISDFTNYTQNEISYVKAAKNSVQDIGKQIRKANKERETLEAEREELKESVKEIEKSKNNVIEYVEKLDKKLVDLENKITDNRKKIMRTHLKVNALKRDKRKALNRQKKQYDTMKKRIKYMYENGSESYIEALFSSSDIVDLLNKSEYVSKVTAYDKSMFQEYKETCNKIEKLKQSVEDKLEQLTTLKNKLTYEKRSLNSLMRRKNRQLSNYNSKIKKSRASIRNYSRKIAEQENQVEELLEKQRIEIQKQEEREKRKNGGKANAGNSTGYGWPLASRGTITSHFGRRSAPTAGASTYHKGIDISIPVGTSVLATKSGTVVTSTYSASAGNYVAIYHGNGVYSYYMHCSSLKVSTGQKVSKGDIIALSGSTGISTGPHLHFALFMNGDYVNPLNYL